MPKLSSIAIVILASLCLHTDLLAQTHYLKASNTGGFDSFGSAVAISGDTMVIGAPGEASGANVVNGNQELNTHEYSGAAYVFVRDGSTWTQQAYLKPSNTGAHDDFGSAVDISGDTIIVGALGEDSNATGVDGDATDNSALFAGAAYVFVRSGTTWTQQAYLKRVGPELSSFFGASVSIDGDRAVVGAPGNSSRAYVFVRNGSTWSHEFTLTYPSLTFNFDFGRSVSISGDTIIVGAPNEKSNATGVNGDPFDTSLTKAGAAWVYVRNGSSWTEQAYLKSSNTTFLQEFGSAVAISGDFAVVGAFGERGESNFVDGDQTGGNDFDLGAAYVFERTGTSWAQNGYLKAFDSDEDDRFGVSVDISSRAVVVGATREESLAQGLHGDYASNDSVQVGAAYLYARNGSGTWSPHAYIKASNAEGQDLFGSSVALSEDFVLVGALGEDSVAVGLNGDQSSNELNYAGSAYLYNLPTSLVGDVPRVSLDDGGQYSMSIDAGVARADWFYWMFGSASGIAPGLDFGNGVLLPLNFDAYFNFTLNKPFSGIFSNYIGQLDANGRATATLTIPPGTDPTLGSLVLNHAYVATEMLGSIEFASNDVRVELKTLNVPPICNVVLAGPGPNAGQLTFFDAGGSFDTDGSIADYSWDFGDGDMAAGPSGIIHSYTDPGSYLLTLTITDDGGADSSCSLEVIVDP